MCVCYRNWQANDCSERVCQFAPAYVDIPKGDLDASGTISPPHDHVAVNSFAYPYGTSESFPLMEDSDHRVLTNSAHQYAECSNAGICNRKTGLCDCQPGFEGAACQRLSCPTSLTPIFEGMGKCSGHGICKTLYNIAKANKDDYSLWDKSISTACVCDAGFFGGDCHQRHCKSALDPHYLDEVLTLNYGKYYLSLLARGNNTYFTDGSTALNSGYFTITVFDADDKAWNTERIQVFQDGHARCHDIVAALENLPNRLVPRGTTICQQTSVIAQDPLARNPAWEFRFYARYRFYFQGPRLDTLEVHPSFWLAGFGSSITANNSYTDAVLSGSIYRLEMNGNVGATRQPEINLHSDGDRSTLQSRISPSPSSPLTDVFAKVWTDGLRSESVNMFSEHCEDVLVVIDKSSDGSYYFLTSFSPGEKTRLMKCLGDADFDSTNNLVDRRGFSWDAGSIYFPHIVRLIRQVTDAADSGYYAALYYDYSTTGLDDTNSQVFTENNIDVYAYERGGTFKLLHPFEAIDHLPFLPPGLMTQFFVYTTKGTLQMANNETEAAFDFASKEIFATNVNLTDNRRYYDGNNACEALGKTAANGYDHTKDLFACLNKGDWFFLIDPYETKYNPPYLNLHRVEALHTNKELIANFPSSIKYNASDMSFLSRYKSNVVLSDLSTNWAQEVSSSPAVFRFYKFFPHPDSNYAFFAECANRGLCNYFEGTCTCFPGYSGDGCSIQEGQML